jgi:hypothetical protein
MGKSNYDIVLKTFGYLFFCAIMWAVTVAWAVGNAMNVNSNIRGTTYQFIVLFSVFMYISYLFWGKNAFIIPVLLVLYLIYDNFIIGAQEMMYLYK